jgi:hypothetical protein
MCTGALNKFSNCARVQGIFVEDPRAISQWMFCFELAALYGKPKGPGT